MENKNYPELLADFQPKTIRDEAEYDRVIAKIEQLLKNKEGEKPNEDCLLDLLSTLVEAYETQRYSFMVQHMEDRMIKSKRFKEESDRRASKI